MKHTGYWLVLCGMLWGMIALSACKHEPNFEVPEVDPGGDTTVVGGGGNPVDTTGNGGGNGGGNGTPCDDDVVYFEQQILPILVSNCALSGCHDAATAQEGVVLTSYERVVATADVRAGRPGNSDLYEVITEDDAEDRMPPPPRSPLTSAQIRLIRDWINQGAENLSCDPGSGGGGGCNTANVTFSGTVRPVLQNNCLGCHSGSAPSGGVLLTNHAQVAAVAASGRLYGAISHQAGFTPMPFGLARLPDCTIQQIKAWIDAGTPNN